MSSEASNSNYGHPPRRFLSFDETTRLSPVVLQDLFANPRVPGDSSTLKIKKFWHTKFDEFYEKSLKLGPKDVPTYQDICEFILVIGPMLDNRGPRGVTSYKYLTDGSRTVQEWVEMKYLFDFRGFEKLWIQSAVDHLLYEGIISKSATVKPHCVTSKDVSKMVKALLEDALLHGTYSWDYVIMQCFFLVLLSITSTRVEDILAADVTPDVCMRWENIMIVAEKRGGKDVLLGSFTFPHCKGREEGSLISRTVTTWELLEPTFNYVCPLKLCLIHALRSGAVPEKSWDQLVRNAKSRHCKGVIWETPSDPVFKSFQASNLGAQIPWAQKVLDRAADLVGILDTITPDDIEQGSAAEEFHSTPKPGNSNYDRVHYSLGHSNSASGHDLTMQYIGDVSDPDAWLKRLTAEYLVSPALRLNYAVSPFTFHPSELIATNEFFTEQDLDSNNPSHRKMFPNLRYRKLKKKWRQEQFRLIEAPSHDITYFSNNAQMDFIPEDEDESSGDNIDNSLGCHPSKRDGITLGDADLVVLQTAPHQFATFFAKHNMILIQSLKGIASVSLQNYRGHSRNEPEIARFKCAFWNYGCKYNSPVRSRLEEHVVTCIFGQRKTHVKVCEVCGRGYSSKQKLDSHVKRHHHWKNRKCPHCDNSTIYTSRQDWESHLDLHLGYSPTTCPIEDCLASKERRVFKLSRSLRVHLHRVHKMRPRQQLKLLGLSNSHHSNHISLGGERSLHRPKLSKIFKSRAPYKRGHRERKAKATRKVETTDESQQSFKQVRRQESNKLRLTGKRGSKVKHGEIFLAPPSARVNTESGKSKQDHVKDTEELGSSEQPLINNSVFRFRPTIPVKAKGNELGSATRPKQIEDIDNEASNSSQGIASRQSLKPEHVLAKDSVSEIKKTHGDLHLQKTDSNSRVKKELHEVTRRMPPRASKTKITSMSDYGRYPFDFDDDDTEGPVIKKRKVVRE